MKYLSALITVLFLAVAAQAQTDAISKYFEKYMDDENFTVVYVSGKMFTMLSRIDIDELKDEEAKAIMEVAQTIKGLRVLVSEVNPLQYYKEAQKMITTDEYELLLTVRDKGDNVKFWVVDDGKIISELFLLVGSADEFVMVSFIGDIDLQKISKLANTLDMKGAKHLEKLGDRIEKEVDDANKN